MIYWKIALLSCISIFFKNSVIFVSEIFRHFYNNGSNFLLEE